MAFDDNNLALFLADMGVSVTDANGNTAQALLDSPDQVENLHGLTGVVGTEFSLTFETVALSMKQGDQITVAGSTYKVRDVLKIDDGAFSKARLKTI